MRYIEKKLDVQINRKIEMQIEYNSSIRKIRNVSKKEDRKGAEGK